jgi:L-ascorbate metabolism protein UlaG (beta-lactamase superfamily)
MMNRFVSYILLLGAASVAVAQDESSIQYLANEGVMVRHAETSILFDPLFNNSFGQYQLVPGDMRAAIMAGKAPYDNVDAVFISHYHDDHFSAADVLQLMKAQTGIHLYAPAQAVVAMREIAADSDEQLFERVTGLDLAYGDSPVSIRTENLTIDAAYVPHSGWPTARTDVQNIVFRVALDGSSTVMHMGDADARVVHFAADEEYWEEEQVDLALPPYWFFGSDDGREILESRINIRHSIGIHVPDKYSNPENVPAGLSNYDIFTRPGEGRRFTGR